MASPKDGNPNGEPAEHVDTVGVSEAGITHRRDGQPVDKPAAAKGPEAPKGTTEVRHEEATGLFRPEPPKA